MAKIEFTKMVASGNDFVIIDSENRGQRTENRELAKKICDRKYGIGADGLLFLEKSRIADVRMRIFNSDGSEAEMCGNGARCAAFYFSRTRNPEPGTPINIETKAGIIAAQVQGSNVKIKLTSPQGMRLDIPLAIARRKIKVNFINTGVPHTVIFVQGIEKLGVFDLGRDIRYHREFAPAGTNVDFVELISPDSLKVRTYERGVEDETLACGTGSVAAALITGYRVLGTGYRKIGVHTKGGEVLKVYFKRQGKKFSNVWLEGKAKIVFCGELN